MNNLQKVIKSLEARGLPYYHGLNKSYPVHFVSFSNMHNRISDKNLETDFPRTYEGFKDFIEYLGDIPIGMKKPTIGRKDHSKGYIRGNFEWQEYSKNSLESTIRNNLIVQAIRNSPTFCKSLELEEFVSSLKQKTLITKELAKYLGWYSTKDLRYGLQNIIKIEKISRGKYYIIPRN
jgi:hypothetical protein